MAYAAPDVVTFQGSSYVALLASTNVAPLGQPSSAADWAVLAESGAAGPAGIQGTVGAQGPMGPSGPVGPVGNTGVSGALGPVGPMGPSGPTGQAGPAGTNQVSFLQTRQFSVQGDSISANFGNAWQNVVIARTGMKLVTQDARGGRTFYNAFECWSNPAVGSPPGNFTSSYALQYGGTCGSVDIGIANGTTFAQSLVNTDLLVIQLGTNDVYYRDPLGELGDAVDSGTYYGNMRWIVEGYLTAKPTMRVVMVTLQSNHFGSASVSQQYSNATVAYANSMGIPILNMYQQGGVNSLTIATLTPDGVHPSTFAFNNFYGPAIAQFLQGIF